MNRKTLRGLHFKQKRKDHRCEDTAALLENATKIPTFLLLIISNNPDRFLFIILRPQFFEWQNLGKEICSYCDD